MKRILFPVLVIVAAAACLDPQHSADQNAQEPSEPGSPTHNAGKWCTACHGTQGPNNPEFSIAGTLYQDTAGTPASGVDVCIQDTSSREPYCLTTNRTGNFYVSKTAYDPVYPLRVNISASKKQMRTIIGRDGGCGRCHQGEKGDREHAPRVYLATEDYAPLKPADGGP
jgi:cytochrome c553